VAKLLPCRWYMVYRTSSTCRPWCRTFSCTCSTHKFRGRAGGVTFRVGRIITTAHYTCCSLRPPPPAGTCNARLFELSFPSTRDPKKNQSTTKRLNSSNSILSPALGPLIISPIMSVPGGKSHSKIGSPAPLMFANTACLKCQRRS